METEFSMRKRSVNYARNVERFRPKLQSDLKSLRCGFTPNWRGISLATQWLYWLAETLRYSQEVEVRALDRVPRLVRPDIPRIVAYKKPRWHRKKAPPKPPAISLSDQETFLEGLLRWMDGLVAATQAPPGECYPALPAGLQAVLGRNGYDPHSSRSPRRILKEYLMD